MSSDGERAPMAPGDEAPPGMAQAGEDFCPDCGGSGQRDGGDCPTCEGSGRVMRVVSGE